MEDFFRTALWDPLAELGRQIEALMPHLFGMLVILIIGIVAAWLLNLGLRRILEVVRFDAWSEKVGFTAFLARGQILESPSRLMGRIIFWTVTAIFIMLALQQLEMRPIDRLIERVFDYIPDILAGLLILAIGYILSNFLARAVLIASVNAQLPHARLLAVGTRWGILLFTLAMALEQLGIGGHVVLVGFSILFGGVVLALALALGLGGKNLAKSFLEERFGRDKTEASEEESLTHL
jgi:hypothetical protein